MLLDKQDSLGLAKNKIYEPVETALIKLLVKPTDTCLDIGAHIGYFTLLMAKLCKKVYAFEADPRNAAVAAGNAKGLDNVTVSSLIVSDKEGWASLYLCDSNSGMHRTYPSKWCTDISISIPSIRIDTHPEIDRIDFIKMDIEGSEMAALKGMERLLTRYHPTMIIEFHPPSIEEYGASPVEEYHFLKTLGYSIRLIPKISIPISFPELEKETRKESGRNLLCLPPNQGRSL